VTEQGYYRVQVADTFGCVLTDSVFIQQYLNPPPPNGILTPEACPGTAITMSVNSFYQFNWFALPDTTFLDFGNQYTTEIQENGQGFGGFVMNQNTGCISSWISTEAVLLTTTSIAAFPEEILYCPGDTVLFEPDESAGIAGGYWNGPNQFTLNQEDLFIADISMSQEGIYTYTAVSAPGFCTYDTARVLIHPRFLDFSQVSYQDTLCRNETLVFSTQEQAGYSYSWTGPPALTASGSDWSYPGVTPENTGLYLLTARDGNCIRTDTFSVFISEIPPQTPTISAITHICNGDTLYLFNADSVITSNAVVTWGGSDLFQFNSPNSVFIPNFQSDNLANYTLQYGINQCLSAISSFSPQFIELPIFAFGKDTVEFCDGEPIQLNSPQESTYYQWNTGSQQSSVTVYESGDLVLTLIDEFGCHYSDTVFVNALNCDMDDTPNAFSPNGDGFNDVLNFKVSGGLLYHAQIFDRWGKNIRAFEGAQEYIWDGTNEQGERVDDGTYFYLLLVKMVNGEVKDIQGTVTVLR
jgi:gliding motility-associated-like protein